MKQRKKLKKERIKRNKGNLRDFWDNAKCPNIRIIGVPEEEDKKKGHEKILEEIIVEKFPNMGKEIDTQVQETQSPEQDNFHEIYLKKCHANGDQKKAGVAILISDKINFEIKTMMRDKEGHYIMIKGLIQEEDIASINIYIPNIGALNT